MKVLAILRPAEGADVSTALAAHASEELRELWRLYTKDAVREVYRPRGPGAVLILEAESSREAQSLLAGLPLLSTATMTLEVIELHPFGAYEMLFASPPG